MTSIPSTRTVLLTLSKARLLELARAFAVSVPPAAPREDQVAVLVDAPQVRFRDLLGILGRDELKAACRTHGLDDAGRARPLLAARLMQAHGAVESAPPRPIFRAHQIPRYAPRTGDIVQVRHRQWLVEDVVPPPEEGHATLVKLVCLDDDNQGRALDVLWELELGAKVLHPETHGLGAISELDPPRNFAAYLHALKWNSVTATDAKLFQAPFRAGIRLMNHQLTPLRKALTLPRANIFIADDVGLGKTIEAGLIAQELLLRQRVEFILIVCPSSVCLQWRDEMQKKFGLHFEVMSRSFIGRRRQERGFGVNPWSTHTRFIVSHQILRRPEYRDPLLQHIGERATKSLLILDEAHVAAPAGSNRYAVDSKITDVIRDIAPRFENRLFLSATPHNGHSNSFSALLELLDPQRFTRGVPVRGQAQLDSVMVRRLKEDLRQLGVEKFPKRTLVELRVGDASSPELTLATKLAEYTALMRPQRGQGALVFINLQKRLLSSVEAFYRTLQAHHRAVTEGRAKTALQL
ncbi:MAG TPA: SNF2-related protein, partial [Polyangiaceae bacterium]